MKIRRMGRTGLKVSEICLGTMTFGHQCDEKTSFAIMDRAAAHGVFFFDTADVYAYGQSETILGQALKDCGTERDKVVIATKVRSSSPLSSTKSAGPSTMRALREGPNGSYSSHGSAAGAAAA